MAARLYKNGLTVDTFLVYPCDIDLVLGFREFFRDLNSPNKDRLFSEALLAQLGDKPTESWAEFTAAIKEFNGIFCRVSRYDRHYLSTETSSIGMILNRCWFSAENCDEVFDQALGWGDALENKERTIFKNHVALSAALVGAHND